MKDLQEATVKICRLKGEIMALNALLASILDTRPADDLLRIQQSFEHHSEYAQVTILNAVASEEVAFGLEEANNVIRGMFASQNQDRR